MISLSYGWGKSKHKSKTFPRKRQEKLFLWWKNGLWGKFVSDVIDFSRKVRWVFISNQTDLSTSKQGHKHYKTPQTFPLVTNIFLLPSKIYLHSFCLSYCHRLILSMSKEWEVSREWEVFFPSHQLFALLFLTNAFNFSFFKFQTRTIQVFSPPLIMPRDGKSVRTNNEKTKIKYLFFHKATPKDFISPSVATLLPSILIANITKCFINLNLFLFCSQSLLSRTHKILSNAKAREVSLPSFFFSHKFNEKRRREVENHPKLFSRILFSATVCWHFCVAWKDG